MYGLNSFVKFRNFEGTIWNSTQNFEPIHHKYAFYEEWCIVISKIMICKVLVKRSPGRQNPHLQQKTIEIRESHD